MRQSRIRSKASRPTVSPPRPCSSRFIIPFLRVLVSLLLIYSIHLRSPFNRALSLFPPPSLRETPLFRGERDLKNQGSNFGSLPRQTPVRRHYNLDDSDLVL